MAILRSLGGSRDRSAGRTAASSAPTATLEPGHGGSTETVELDPRSVRGLRVAYAPDRDGAPDAGEIVWTWVPYAERDGRGKDRPVLVIATQSADRVYAVKLTSKSHDGDRDFLSLGSGPWDGQGRESWVDIDQLYSVHVSGVRREAAALDRRRFESVAGVLERRFGWAAA
ncbi:MAG: type II toxin-antitoxin system PemK/MazF family toxin [Actinobacteria bacterium]|nr:type II toxin-antitoxin system PemK/MazF family toxin [Actinomycetota bacterium]